MMASLAYVAVPQSAARLHGGPSAASLQRAKRIVTSLPIPSPASDPLSSPNVAPSVPSPPMPSSITSPTAAAFSLLPQMLLSSAIPASAAGPKEKEKQTRGNSAAPVLLTTKDPLSIPTTTANFKRFVAKSGPIFWFQDRVEEVVMWKRGWRVTGVWMAAYAFFCYFPKMVFAIPHLVLIGIMLASYPYPDLQSSSSNSASASTPTPASSTDSVNWQANLQAIQNLMGFVADTHDLIQPHTHLILLSPSHLPSNSSNPSPPPISPYPPYIFLALLVTFPPLILLLACPFFPSRLICLIAGLGPLCVTHPRIFPFLQPLSRVASSSALFLCQDVLTILVQRYKELRRLWAHFTRKFRWARTGATVDARENEETSVLPPLQTILERLRDDDRLDDTCWRSEMREVELYENERYTAPRGADSVPHRTSIDSILSLPSYPDGDVITASSTLTRSGRSSSDSVEPTSSTYSTPTVISAVTAASAIPQPTMISSDSLRLSTASLPTSLPYYTLAPVPHSADPGWNKVNLRPGERRAWTRGRDGWGGILSEGDGSTPNPGGGANRRPNTERRGSGDRNESGRASDGSRSREAESLEEGEGSGEGFVSSNLTFSLAAGWAFVRTEGWRRDRMHAWIDFDNFELNCAPSMNLDGWVYTNDTWGDARPTPYPGCVTRRRRWVRRIWFDPQDGGNK